MPSRRTLATASMPSARSMPPSLRHPGCARRQTPAPGARAAPHGVLPEGKEELVGGRAQPPVSLGQHRCRSVCDVADASASGSPGLRLGASLGRHTSPERERGGPAAEAADGSHATAPDRRFLRVGDGSAVRGLESLACEKFLKYQWWWPLPWLPQPWASSLGPAPSVRPGRSRLRRRSPRARRR